MRRASTGKSKPIPRPRTKRESHRSQRDTRFEPRQARCSWRHCFVPTLDQHCRGSQLWRSWEDRRPSPKQQHQHARSRLARRPIRLRPTERSLVDRPIYHDRTSPHHRLRQRPNLGRRRNLHPAPLERIHHPQKHRIYDGFPPGDGSDSDSDSAPASTLKSLRILRNSFQISALSSISFAFFSSNLNLLF